MNHLKKLTLIVAMSVSSLVVLGAGPASATELYKFTTPSANDTLGAGTVLKSSVKAGTSVLLENTPWQFKLSTCLSGELNLTTATAGGESSHPSGKVTGGFGVCSHFAPIINGGEMEFRHIAGTTNAKVIWKNFETSFPNTVFGLQCIAKSGPEAEAGTLTGASSASGHATLDISMPVTMTPAGGGEFPCGSGVFTGTFTVTTPTGLIVEAK